MPETRNPDLKPTAHTSFDPETDLVDLKGKVIIVTGGNAGIGFATVRHLLRARAGKVYLAARDEGRAKNAIKLLNDESLGKDGSGSEVLWHKLELGDPAKTMLSAEQFLKKESRLDVIVNNAGGLLSVQIGKEGVNHQHLVNYISPYIFTKTLLPLLKKTAQEPNSDVRIVNLSSEVHFRVPAGAKFKTVEDFNVPYKWHIYPGMTRYGHAKLAMTLWSRKLQEDLLPSESLPNGITVISLHPGVVDTFSVRFPGPFNGIARFFFRTVFGFIAPEHGSYTSLFAAASKKILDERERYQAGWGAYLHDGLVPGSVLEPSADALNDTLKEDLIKSTEKFLENLGL